MSTIESETALIRPYGFKKESYSKSKACHDDWIIRIFSTIISMSNIVSEKAFIRLNVFIPFRITFRIIKQGF